MSYDSLQEHFILTPKPGCPLQHTDLIVYSYMAKRERFGGKPPSNIAIAMATGLDQRTVAASVARLEDAGFMSERRPVHQPDHFFGRGGSKRGHWSETIQFFPCLVRSETSPLLTTDVMVFSYIRHLATLDKKPSRLTCAYVANAVCTEDRTVTTAFSRLTQLQLLRITPDRWAVPDSLLDVQREWFMPKRSAPDATAPEIGTFTPDPEALKVAPASSDHGVAPAGQVDILHTEEMFRFIKDRLDLMCCYDDYYEPLVRSFIEKWPETERENWAALADEIQDRIEAIRERAISYRP